MGVDVDIVTGEPKEAKEPKPQTSDQVVKEAGEGEVLERELKSARGQKFVQIVIDKLEARINELMKADGECQGILKILFDMKVKINLARGMAEKIAKGSIK